MWILCTVQKSDPGCYLRNGNLGQNSSLVIPLFSREATSEYLLALLSSSADLQTSKIRVRYVQLDGFGEQLDVNSRPCIVPAITKFNKKFLWQELDSSDWNRCVKFHGSDSENLRILKTIKSININNNTWSVTITKPYITVSCDITEHLHSHRHQLDLIHQSQHHSHQNHSHLHLLPNHRCSLPWVYCEHQVVYPLSKCHTLRC